MLLSSRKNLHKTHKYSIEIASLSTAAAGQGAAGAAAAALRLDPAAVAREGFVNVGGGHFGLGVVVGQGGLGLVEEELESSRLCDTLAFSWLGIAFSRRPDRRGIDWWQGV